MTGVAYRKVFVLQFFWNVFGLFVLGLFGGGAEGFAGISI